MPGSREFLEGVPRFDHVDVADRAEFTWVIGDWFGLPSTCVSEEFCCGGHVWQILLYPRGIKHGLNNGGISIYLITRGPATSSPPPSNDPETVKKFTSSKFTDVTNSLASKCTTDNDWSVCASFLISMWNPKDDRAHQTKANFHRYDQSSRDWGYTEFMHSRTAFVGNRLVKVPVIGPTLSSSASPLNADPSTIKYSVNLTVRIDVLNDTTGVLWHDFGNYNSRVATGFTGLLNQGATCYLNSLLQSLYFTKPFRDAIYSYGSADGVCGGLQRLFFRLHKSAQPVDTADLTYCFGWDSEDMFMQHDVQELERILIDKVEGELKDGGSELELASVFCGRMRSYIKCTNVPMESSRVEDFWDIQLQVREMPNVIASFENYCAAETLKDDNRYDAGEYGLQEAIKGVTFEHFPPVLHLQLKRYEFNWATETEVKVNDRYEFGMELDLNKFVDKPDLDYTYCLHSVLVHRGDLNSGHYYALIRPRMDTNQFYLFDDDRVTKATERQVLEENFGGPNQTASAYMLVYIRKDSIPKLNNSDNDEPPARIERDIREKRANTLRKRRALDEELQSKTFYVLTKQNFIHHTGRGIYNSDRPLQELEIPQKFKFPKQTPISEIYKRLNVSYLFYIQHNIHDGFRTAFGKCLTIPKYPDFYIGQVESKSRDPKQPPIFFTERIPAALDFEPGPHMVFVFIKQLNGELRGSDAFWIDNTAPLNDALAKHGLKAKHFMLEITYPSVHWSRDKKLYLVELNGQGSAAAQRISNTDIIIPCDDPEPIYDYFELETSQILAYFYPYIRSRDPSYANYVQTPTSEEQLVSSKYFSFKINRSTTYESIIEQVEHEAQTGKPNFIQLLIIPPDGRPYLPLKSDGSNLDLLQQNSVGSEIRLLYRIAPIKVCEFENQFETCVNWISKGTLLPPTRRDYFGLAEDRVVEKFTDPNAIVWAAKDPYDFSILSDVTMEELHDLHTKGYTVYADQLNSEDLELLSNPERFFRVGVISFQNMSQPVGVPFHIPLIKTELFAETKLRIHKLLCRDGSQDRLIEKLVFYRVGPDYKIINRIDRLDSNLYEMFDMDDYLAIDYPERRNTQQLRIE